MSVIISGALPSGISKVMIVSYVHASVRAVKRKNDTLAVVFTSAKKICNLNTIYRGKNEVTDILSFPAEIKGDLGDIFIFLGSARKKAKARGMEFKKYIQLLVVHGVLHLAGYDHKKTSGTVKMERLEAKILKSLEHD